MGGFDVAEWLFSSVQTLARVYRCTSPVSEQGRLQSPDEKRGAGYFWPQMMSWCMLQSRASRLSATLQLLAIGASAISSARNSGMQLSI